MLATIPKNLADNDYDAFPKGLYRGTLVGTESVSNSDGTWGGVSIRVEDITPLDDGSEEVNGRAYVDTITVMATDKEGTLIALPDATDFRSLPFGLQKGAGLLAGLADAVGAGERDENLNVVFDIEAFLAALSDGNFNGREISFQVTHYTNPNTKVTRHQTARIAAAG